MQLDKLTLKSQEALQEAQRLAREQSHQEMDGEHLLLALLGQTLIVTAGCGRAQREGGPIEEIRAGDVVWFPPGEKHWHGAAPTTALTHIAIQEQLDGKAVDWLEKVSDEQYQG